MRFILVLFSIFFYGCAYVEMENRYLPYKVKDLKKETETISPQNINLSLKFKDWELFSLLTLSSKSYRGLQFLGIEISRDEDIKAGYHEFAISLGIKTNIKRNDIILYPGQIYLTAHRKNGDLLHLEPVAVFEVSSDKFCSFDFNEHGWGQNSKKLDINRYIKISPPDKGNYVCFNALYSIDVDDTSMFELKTGNFVPSLSHQVILFRKTKVKTISSN